MQPNERVKRRDKKITDEIVADFKALEQYSVEDIKTSSDATQPLEKPNQRLNKSSDNLKVLIIEDDTFAATDYGLELSALGTDVYYVEDAASAITFIRYYSEYIDFVILDIRLPFEGYCKSKECSGGTRTGVLLLKEIKDIALDIYVIGLTNSTESLNFGSFKISGSLLIEKSTCSPKSLATLFKRLFMKKQIMLQSFIVHGHDNSATHELKDYIQNTLHLLQPIVLSEQKSAGMTVIEKFEHYASKVDIVFSILTPDDAVSGLENVMRPRPNVIFELGYFMGVLGRKSGKVFLLYKKGVEIPSDLSGIIYIDITNGVLSASEYIRRELEDLLN
jgi:predicted nucleotide-binding protein